jgi:hypothetical protein
MLTYMLKVGMDLIKFSIEVSLFKSQSTCFVAFTLCYFVQKNRVGSLCVRFG